MELSHNKVQYCAHFQHTRKSTCTLLLGNPECNCPGCGFLSGGGKTHGKWWGYPCRGVRVGPENWQERPILPPKRLAFQIRVHLMGAWLHRQCRPFFGYAWHPKGTSNSYSARSLVRISHRQSSTANASAVKELRGPLETIGSVAINLSVSIQMQARLPRLTSLSPLF